MSEPYDQQREGSYMVKRSYTPPIPQYDPDYEYQSAVGVEGGLTQPNSLLLHTSNPNYAYQSSLDYPPASYPVGGMERRNSQPYPAGPRPEYAKMNEYGGEGDMPPMQYSNDGTPIRGHSVLMAPHQPTAFSSSSRTASSAAATYQLPYSDFNTEQLAQSQLPPPSQHYYMHEENDGSSRYNYSMVTYNLSCNPLLLNS